jgi:predicted metal-dependent HD superfamily phosphohydrolase
MISEKQIYDEMRAAALLAMENHKRLGLEYHNSEHITHAMLTHERLYADSSPSGMAQKLALMYHDVVYVPGCTTNEELSAKFFKWQLKRVVGCSTYDHLWTKFLDENATIEPQDNADLLWCCMFVPVWIQSTTVTHHLSAGAYSKSIDRILDCDLAALAKPYPAFKSQQFALSAESLPGASQEERLNDLKKQADFLWAFLSKEPIFRTPEAHESLEKQARENITLYFEEIQHGHQEG